MGLPSAIEFINTPAPRDQAEFEKYVAIPGARIALGTMGINTWQDYLAYQKQKQTDPEAAKKRAEAATKKVSEQNKPLLHPKANPFSRIGQ